VTRGTDWRMSSKLHWNEWMHQAALRWLVTVHHVNDDLLAAQGIPLHVMRFEDVAADVRGTLKQTLEFIGVCDWPCVCVCVCVFVCVCVCVCLS
jgi:hypothetical protein